MTLADVRLAALRVFLAGLPPALFAAIVAPEGERPRLAVAAEVLCARGLGLPSLVEQSRGRRCASLRAALFAWADTLAGSPERLLREGRAP